MATRVKYDRGWRGLKAELKEHPEKVQRKAQQIVNECAEMGQEIMQEMVDREKTGLMKSEVKVRKARSSYFYARFGWVEEWRDYFYYQDRGFTHTSGKKVEGMHALFRSFMIVREEFERRIKEATK